jgi:proprotein convertase subtilisin/kexin type 5
MMDMPAFHVKYRNKAECGTGYFGLNGTCLTCPFKCATCVLNTQATKATYLICTACLPGYSLSSDAICRALCNGLVAQSANGNGTCFTCGDINCQLCSSQTTCTRCTPLYSLSNGQCLMNCSATQTAAFGGSGSFVCLSNIANCLTITTAYINGTGYLQCLSCNVGTYIYGDSCVTTCPAGTNPDSTTSSCKCATVGYILINKVCTQMTTCPIKMYYNNTINACLACPYGCLTCTGAPDVCYSCALGYIYFAYSSPFCGFNSPFYQCIVGYTLDAATRRCLPDVVALEYMGCRAAAPGCSVCLYQSSITCIVCQNGTFLYMNQCLLGCPNGTWAYLGVCTQNNPYDQNCLTQGIRSNSSYFYSNTTSVSNSAMYPWYIQNLNLLDNNPITTLLYNSIFDNTTRPSYWR